jgi:citrate lyase subunit alpha/citrate CoA-transferase
MPGVKTGNLGTAVNQLDIVVLSALEVDIEYNINVLTGSDGVIRGAIGGHAPEAALICLRSHICSIF